MRDTIVAVPEKRYENMGVAPLISPGLSYSS